MSQYDSMQLMDHRLSLLELSPSQFDSPMTGMLKASTNTYSQLTSLKKKLVVKIGSLAMLSISTEESLFAIG